MWGWDEKLFGAIYSASKAVFSRRSKPPSPGRVELEAVKIRLQCFAAMLSGEPVVLRESESVGGFRGDVILLPPVMDLAWDAEPTVAQDANYAAYRFRVAYTLASRQRGVTFRPCDPWTDYLSTSIEVVPTLRLALARWPKACTEFFGRLGVKAKRDPIHEELLFSLLRLEDNRYSRPLVEAMLELDQNHRRNHSRQELEDKLAWSKIREQALRWMQQKLVRPRRLFPPSELIGALLPPLAILSSSPGDTAQMPSSPEQEQDAPSTVVVTKPRDYANVRDCPDDPENENPVIHNFEKVNTADHYSGGQRSSCGDDELSEHKKALDELDLRDIVRTKKQTASVYQSNILSDIRLPQEREESGTGYSYHEWEHRRSRYVAQHCSLYEQRFPAIPGSKITLDWVEEVYRRYRSEADLLSAELWRARDALRPATRQREGEDIDIDALIRTQADLKAGECSDDRFYIRQKRALPSSATLLLLDLSHSSDAYVDGKRILDIIKETTVILAKVLEDMPYPVEIAAFYGNTHQNCRYSLIKEFPEPWSLAWERIASMIPQGYTRIGAAVRHASTRLAATRSRRQTLILMTDAKPTDYDGYEGSHGEMDVRKALSEGRAQRIDDYAIVLSSSRSAHHKTMFGHNRGKTATSAPEAACLLVDLLRDQSRR